ncbi:Sec-independent protein translocase subunit TatA/TatB [Phocaeicola vulgatus]|jgi:sec-independent protein translocase protein TatA|uniref:Sec-independent protein translocase subunit TatA/TatB n=1 Tax=Phocaeicola vulgatus TaxID=821 RepID=UPI003DA4B641
MTLLFIGTTELLLIAGVALLFFGGKKLPEMMRGLGQGVKQFKEGMKDVTVPIEESINSKEQNDFDNQTEKNNDDNMICSESKEQKVDETKGK